jgi:hypothetical protein
MPIKRRPSDAELDALAERFRAQAPGRRAAAMAAETSATDPRAESIGWSSGQKSRGTGRQKSRETRREKSCDLLTSAPH